MELGFENDIQLLNLYKTIQNRKTIDYKKFLAVNEKNKSDYQQLVDCFWDVIVITAIDQQQKEYYEQVLIEKMNQNQIPSFIHYVVISDPIGEKIGCGGSTLYVLSTLSKMYGDDNIKKMKILLLHAGGYSKRLPNHSTTGKIFASIPCTLDGNDDDTSSSNGNDNLTACSMLEIKLIILIDIPKRMKPGIFLACSDDIELFESNEIPMNGINCGADDDDTIGKFIALSQPGTLDIGVGHGVFVLDTIDKYTPNKLNTCRKFIHKPSKEKMKLENAILSNGLVLMDSCYYFNHSATLLLLQYYNENSPLTCEIDAYSDFLQPLGGGAEPTYFETKSNVTTYLPQLPGEREKIYNLLNSNKCKLEMIPMTPSAFIHIGTCHEYIEHFTINFPKLGFKNIVFSKINNDNITNSIKSNNNTIIHSIIENVSNYNSGSGTTSSNSVIEYCKFNNLNQLSIGSRCIVSDLEFNGTTTSGSDISSTILIPSNSFIQTLLISSNRYVTIFFGIDDDLKTTNCPKLFNVPLPVTTKPSSSSPLSLWNASLFPVSNISTQDSLLKTLNHINNTNNIDDDTNELYSIEKCLNEKDLSKQFIRRSELTKLIKKLKE